MSKCSTFKKINFRSDAKHKIVITERSETPGDMGGTAISESTLATLWAIIEPMKQFEKTQFDKLDSEVTHKIIVRYSSIFANPLNAVKYRINFGSRIFEIHQAIDYFEDNRFVEMIANEVQS